MIRQFIVGMDDDALRIEIHTDAPRVTCLVRDPFRHAQAFVGTETNADTADPGVHVINVYKLTRDGATSMPPDERELPIHKGGNYHVEIQAHHAEGPDDTLHFQLQASKKDAEAALGAS